MSVEKPIERVTSDPGIFGGKPIIRGTRIAVDLIYDWIAAVSHPAEILEDYPNLTALDIQAAMDFTDNKNPAQKFAHGGRLGDQVSP